MSAFGGGYWFIGEEEGTRYCWSKEPTLERRTT